jgi:competence protein ComEA
MPASLPSFPAPRSPLHQLRQSFGARLVALVRASPGRTATAALGVIAVSVLVWWALRPPVQVPVEATLPRVTTTSVGTAAQGAAGTPAASATGTGGAAVAVAAVIVVHVAGAVAHPGLVELATGARVADAVAAAGGAAADADLDRVNLAAKITDGLRVLVPRMGEASGTDVVADAGGSVRAATPSGPIDLNTASASELDALPGVGPATAAAIVSYREQHGNFTTIDALTDVPGIGPAKLAQLRPLVQV